MAPSLNTLPHDILFLLLKTVALQAPANRKSDALKDLHNLAAVCPETQAIYRAQEASILRTLLKGLLHDENTYELCLKLADKEAKTGDSAADFMRRAVMRHFKLLQLMRFVNYAKACESNWRIFPAITSPYVVYLLATDGLEKLPTADIISQRKLSYDVGVQCSALQWFLGDMKETVLDDIAEYFRKVKMTVAADLEQSDLRANAERVHGHILKGSRGGWILLGELTHVWGEAPFDLEGMVERLSEASAEIDINLSFMDAYEDCKFSPERKSERLRILRGWDSRG